MEQARNFFNKKMQMISFEFKQLKKCLPKNKLNKLDNVRLEEKSFISLQL